MQPSHGVSSRQPRLEWQYLGPALLYLHDLGIELVPSGLSCQSGFHEWENLATKNHRRR